MYGDEEGAFFLFGLFIGLFAMFALGVCVPRVDQAENRPHYEVIAKHAQKDGNFALTVREEDGDIRTISCPPATAEYVQLNKKYSFFAYRSCELYVQAEVK